jgi:hypothetical protein
MKQANVFLKAAVLLSSVLLLSAFVCYRAGAFDRFLKNSASPVDSGGDGLSRENLSDDFTSVPGSATGAEPPASNQMDGDRAIMSSSKSIIVRGTDRIHTRVSPKFAPNTAQAEPPAPPVEPVPKATERTILPGPKSFGPIIVPPPATAPATPPSTGNQSTKPSR